MIQNAIFYSKVFICSTARVKLRHCPLLKIQCGSYKSCPMMTAWHSYHLFFNKNTKNKQKGRKIAKNSELAMVGENQINKDRELHNVLHMNGGDGEKSYANNSFFQRKVMLEAKPILQESFVELLISKEFPESVTIADMGCSSGPNTFLPIWEIIETIDVTCKVLKRKSPVLQVFLNDLPGNDFNSIFKSLPNFHKKLEKYKGSKFGPCFVQAAPGNFYGRLFPPKSLHYVHSSYSLQWCSKVPNIPINKRNIYLAKTSPPSVHKAYLDQFQRDFQEFLRCRSEELIPGGQMVLTIYGRDDNIDLSGKYNPHSFELLGNMLNDMVSEGLLQKSKLDSFIVPFYGPTAEEVKNVIKLQGSFNIKRFKSFNIRWDACINDSYKDQIDKYTKGKYVSNHIRAIMESILATHFGIGSELIDLIFERFSIVIGDYLETKNGCYTSHVFSMTKE